jgi:hypothetical protein
MVFQPRRSIGVLVGIAIILSLLAFDALLLFYLRQNRISLVFFILALVVALSLPLLLLLGYLVYALVNLRYQLHRDTLTIVWGATRWVIPMSSIEKVVLGQDVGREIRVRGINWPGYQVGHGQVEGMGRTLFYATEPLVKQILVVTPSLAYSISPADLVGFLDAFEIRKHMGPIRLVSYKHLEPGFLSWPVWRDRLAHVLLAVGLGTNLALFGYLCCGYHSLTEGFKPPAIGLVSLVINSSLGILIHHRQRVGAYLLWGGAVVVQFLSWLATLNILS